MSQWFYERDGIEHGPVSEAALGSLYARGALFNDTLVWPTDAVDRRTSLLASGVPLPAREAAQQVPPVVSISQDPATLSPSTPTAASDDEVFFGSPLVRAYVGKNADTYIARWRKMHAKSGGNWDKTISQPSWNWSAFLIPYAWTFYRKMWVLGAGVLAILVALNFSHDRAASLISVGICFATAIMANALYLRQVRAFWVANKTISGSENRATKEGGTNLWAGLGGVAVLSVIAAVAGTNADEFAEAFRSGATCSSKATEGLVAKIAREQMTKQGLAFMGIDIPGTAVSLDAIRTQNDKSRKTECAATINYNVKLGAGAEKNANLQALGEVLKSDITYTVEKTDDGKNIYVTVFGLKQ